MKKYTALSLAVFAAVASTNALAFFDNKNKWDDPKCWYQPNNCNPYDQWDPRYWTEEFKQTWDNNNSYYGPYGYGGPLGGYGMPYGGGYGAPGMRPYGPGFYGRPMRPYGGPAMARPMPGQNAAPPPRPVAPARRPENPASS